MTRHLENGDAHRELQTAPRSQENQENAEKTVRVQRAVEENRSNGENRNENRSSEPRRLAAGEWLRAVMGFSAPFGHDGMPTVWG